MNTYYALDGQPIVMNVDKARRAMLFRMYAKLNIYPQNQILIGEMFRKNFGDNVDIDTDDGVRYVLKCRSKKSDSLYFSQLIELSLIDLFSTIYAVTRPAIVYSDYNRVQQHMVLSVLDDITIKRECSEYLKMIYILTCIHSSTVIKIISLLL